VVGRDRGPIVLGDGTVWWGGSTWNWVKEEWRHGSWGRVAGKCRW